MKLKSILIIAMVAIMAMAGGAFAATTAFTSTNTISTPGFGHADTGIPGCAIVVGTTAACAVWTAAQITAFTNDSLVGATTSGTGLVGGMPPQVTYAANQYTGGVGPNDGYAMNTALFGWCGAVCPKFVPTSGATGTSAIAVAGAIPVGVDNFNEATFSTGLVSGFTGGVSPDLVSNQLSQKTAHHSLVTGGVGTNTDGDFIDQRLAQIIGTNQTLAQAAVIGASSGTSVNVSVDTGAQDPLWLLNVDPFGGPNVQNGGVINQAITDNQGGVAGASDVGSYGQLFANTDVTVSNAIVPALVPGPAPAYVANSGVIGTSGGNLSLP